MASRLRFLDVLDSDSFDLVPPCADPRFDHRSCDYWEDADRGSKAARASWLATASPPPGPARAGSKPPDNPLALPPRVTDNPFAQPPRDANPFASGHGAVTSGTQARSAALSALAGDEDDDAELNPF